jgi:XRE family transcriptional regulator, regulator of sulfur utilization
MNICRHIAENILDLRKKRNLTQSKLADISGIPRSTITYIESGEGNPTIQAIAALASGLQVSIEELMSKRSSNVVYLSKENVPLISKSGGGVQIKKLLPEKVAGMEFETVEIKPNSRMRGTPHVPYSREYMYCMKGAVEIAVAGEKYSLSAGDVIAFPGDSPHSYFNSGTTKNLFLSVVVLAFEGS